MKATMMKVSDPIIFGHAVRVYFAELFEKHGATFDELGADVNNGFGDVCLRSSRASGGTAAEIEADIEAGYAAGPALRWSTRTEASPTCTCPATSSSMPRCRQ